MDTSDWAVIGCALAPCVLVVGYLIGRWSALDELKDAVAPPPDEDDE